jgi:hypothetical protein
MLPVKDALAVTYLLLPRRSLLVEDGLGRAEGCHTGLGRRWESGLKDSGHGRYTNTMKSMRVSGWAGSYHGDRAPRILTSRRALPQGVVACEP